MLSLSLDDLGWNEQFARAFDGASEGRKLIPGRITLQQRGRYQAATAAGEMPAELETRLRKSAASAADLPSVGDWVTLRPAPSGHALATICGLLPRLTKFSRKAAGADNTEQVLAANVDTIFIAMGLDLDFNVRRLERYLTVAGASGGRPVVLLTKSDLCQAEELAARAREVEAIAPEIPVILTSVLSDPDVHAVDRYLERGQTIVLLGSSGVGKSTLVNALLQRDVLRTGQVRPSDSRGRHTTTQRQMFRVRGDALVIDTPGIRELQLWQSGAGFETSFADVDSVAAGCRFRDCRHQHEPGCAVTAAVARGELPADRMASFSKLKAEQAAGTARQAPEADRRRRRADGPVSKPMRRKHTED